MNKSLTLPSFTIKKLSLFYIYKKLFRKTKIMSVSILKKLVLLYVTINTSFGIRFSCINKKIIRNVQRNSVKIGKI